MLLPRIIINKKILYFYIISSLTLVSLFILLIKDQNNELKKSWEQLKTDKGALEILLNKKEEELKKIKNEDQYLKNSKLEEEINNIILSYKSAVTTYEKLLSLKEKTKETERYDVLFTDILVLLSQQNYASASSKLAELENLITQEEEKIAAVFVAEQEQPASSISVNNQAPSSGYSRQYVKTDAGTLSVDIVAADLNNARVIVDTASAVDCRNDCPVTSLLDYVNRNSAFAGINGSYFCPATYPSCADKKNTYDTLLMNKDKHYFNSDNNVFSTVPAVIFGNGWVRFVPQSLEWGRDTSVDSVIANQPMLIHNYKRVFGGDEDPKKSSKGNRSFVANKGNIVYIGVVFNASVAQSAFVMEALGMENAINLDDGGSTALYSNGYKVGPGRNIPNAILFVRK